MHIVLNEQPLDVTFEEEKTLGDVYTSLKAWLHDGGITPIRMEIDNTEVNIHQQSDWSSMALEGIDELRLEAGNINQLRQTQLITCTDYLNYLSQVCRSGDDALEYFTQTASDYAAVRQALPELLQMSEAEFSRDYAVLDTSASEIGTQEVSTEDFLQFASILDQLRTILIDRLRELNSPEEELQNTARLMQSLLPSLEQAGIALQTGKDKDAYTVVFRISEISGKLIRLINILSIESRGTLLGELSGKLDELAKLIEEINDSIRDGDSVLLADLLEYDLREQMEDLVTSLQSIQREGQ